MSTPLEWDELRRRLEALAAKVADEIRSYPRPITACDAQFNHLLELRQVVPSELERLQAASDDPKMRIGEFISSSPCADEMSNCSLTIVCIDQRQLGERQ